MNDLSTNTMTDHERCQQVLRLIANPLVLEIIDLLADGPGRFNNLQRQTKANTATLAKRLQALAAVAVITRTKESADHQAVMYELSALGRECLPMVRAAQRAALRISEEAAAM